MGGMGLATSALAVRVATSVRSSPYPSLLAGLATVEGDLFTPLEVKARLELQIEEPAVLVGEVDEEPAVLGVSGASVPRPFSKSTTSPQTSE